jgi:hypothetical protein
MSLAEFASQYAPALADIASQLEEFDAVICGCSAGPQKPDAPEQRQHLAICIDNPWREPDQWVTVYSASHCEWWSHGEEYRLSLADLLAYLRQLPRPLHSFSKYQP